MFVKNLSEGWELHDNSSRYFLTGGNFYAMSYLSFVPKLEDMFVDPYNPTEDEWLLFLLEKGHGERMTEGSSPEVI